MKKTKILITVEGGNIQAIDSNSDIEVVIINYDLPEGGADDFVYYYPSEKSFKNGKAYELVTYYSPLENEAREKLKNMKF